MWIRGDIRDGRNEEQKSRMLSRILQEVSRIGEIAEEEVWVYLSDIPAQNGSAAPAVWNAVLRA